MQAEISYRYLHVVYTLDYFGSSVQEEDLDFIIEHVKQCCGGG